MFQNLGPTLSFVGAQEMLGIFIGRYCGERFDVRIAEIADVRPLDRSYASSDWKDGPLHPTKQTSTGGRASLSIKQIPGRYGPRPTLESSFLMGGECCTRPQGHRLA